MSEAPPREIIAQRYRLLGQIGKGGMGSVWRAEHTSLRTEVAIKLLDPRFANDPGLRARFLREAQSAAALKSVHVVQILDHGVDEDLPYIAMELLGGESLRERLRRTPVLSPASVARVMAGVCRAIARAHRGGIVHRDLKPDNIFLAKDEELGEVVKVVDFGIAKLLDDATSIDVAVGPGGAVSTATGTMLGTPYYMSPEQLRGKKEIDGRADLWALGVIVFECLVGKRPFIADAVGELVLTICASPPPIPSQLATVPPGFDAWFAKAVARQQTDRFQTVQDLASSLEPLLSPGERWLPTELDVSTPAALGRASVPSAAPSSDSLANAPTEASSEPDREVPSASAAGHSISSTPRTSTLGARARWGLVAAAVAVTGAAAIGYARSTPDEDIVARVRSLVRAGRALSPVVPAVAPSGADARVESSEESSPTAGSSPAPVTSGVASPDAPGSSSAPAAATAGSPRGGARGGPRASASGPAAPSAPASPPTTKLPKLQE